MAIGPIDYSGQVQTPFASALQGYQLGSAIRTDQQQQVAAQQQQAAQLQMQRDLATLAANRNATGADYAQVMTRYPALAENLTKSWGALNADQQQATLSTRSQIYAALKSGNTDVAEQLLQQSAAAKTKAGLASDAQADNVMAQMVRLHPETALTSAGLWLAGVPGGDKILTSASTIGTEQRATDQAPADLAIKNATAGIKGVEAGNAPTKTALDNANSAEDIETKRAQRDIAALNTQIGQANSETQRGELILKRDEMTQKLAQTQKDRSMSAQDAVDTLTQTRDTVDALMKHPGLNGGRVVGGAGTMSGRLLARVPGTDDTDFRAQIETLQAQNFQSQIKTMTGLGALSDAEGKKLSAAIANLDPNQSEAQLRNNLGVVRRYLDKATAKQVASGNLPTAGGAFVLRHPQFGNVTDGDINKLLAKNPGATRQQVLDYLQSTSGKPAAAAPGSGGATGSY